MKSTTILACICALCGVLTFSGCIGGEKSKSGGKPEVTGATAANAPAKAVAKVAPKGISHLTFSLPEQITWEQNTNPKLDEIGAAEWYVSGTTPQTTPARVLYQKMKAAPAAHLKSQLLKPLEKCPDTQVTEFKSGSKYTEQTAFEAICSKFGDEGFGLISYISFYTDDNATHLVLAEAHTLASDKAGLLSPRNDEEKKAAETSKILVDLMQSVIQSIRVCDDKNLCI